jgi:hypothetical protein
MYMYYPSMVCLARRARVSDNGDPYSRECTQNRRDVGKKVPVSLIMLFDGITPDPRVASV